MRWLPLLLLPLLCTTVLASSQNKKPKASVRVFTEASEADTEKFAQPVQLRYPPRQAYLGKIPQISEFDIVSAYPFQAPDGTMGCAFKLDAHGSLALDTMSIQYKGRAAVVMINGRYVVDMIIDKRIRDGVLSVPFGLTQQDIEAIRKEWPTRKEKSAAGY